MTYTGAFIVPVGTYKGDTYLYFGLERNKEVSAFGGKRDNHESIQKCARRELKEESLSAFAKDKTIKKKLAEQKKYNVHKIDTRNTCVTYFVPLKMNGNPIAKFDKARNQKGLKRHQKEMSEVIAIKASDVIKLVNHPAATKMTIQGHNVRPLLASVLRNAVQNNYI